MNCDFCSEPIQAHEEKVLDQGKDWHKECHLDFQAAQEVMDRGIDPPEPSELELAYRRGDEMETVRRMGRDLIGRIQRDFEALVRESSKVMAERDSALRRCKELEEMARRRSPNPPEGAEVHNV